MLASELAKFSPRTKGGKSSLWKCLSSWEQASKHSSPLTAAKIYFIALSFVFRIGRDLLWAPRKLEEIINKQICANISASKLIKVNRNWILSRMINHSRVGEF